MKKIKMIILLILIAVTAVIFLYYSSIKTESYANKGTIDLNKISLSDKGVISLNGEWEFYWNKLLEPEDFWDNKDYKTEYIKAPSNWSKASNNKYAETGCATYRLVLDGIDPNRQYGLIKKNMRIASRIYIDGKLLMKDGQTSESKEQEIMGNSPQVIFFEPQDDKTEIIIQVSNYRYYSGGIVEAIRFGYLNDILNVNRHNIIFESFAFAVVIGLGIIIGIISLLTTQFQKNQKPTAILSIAVISFAIMNGSLSQRIIKLYFAGISTEALIRIEYVAISLMVMALIESIYITEEKFIPNNIKKVLVGVYIVFTAVFIILPLDFQKIWIAYTYFTTLVILIIFIRLLTTLMRNEKLSIDAKEHAFLIFIMYILNVYNLDLLLFTIGVKSNMDLALIAGVLYGISWLSLIIYRYNEAYKKNEELSFMLLENHYNLEKTSLNAKRNEMAFLQAQIKPHFLFNSLSGVIGLLGYNPNRATNLLINLSEYLKNIFDIDMSSEFIQIESELEIIYSYVNIEKERFGERLSVKYDIDQGIASFKIIPLLIQPLVENAITHGAMKRETGGMVSLSIKKEDEKLLVSVEDNGPGFSKEAIEKLNNEKNYHSRKGVGVKNVIDRLKLYYNEELIIKDRNEGGVYIEFTVPAMEGENEIVGNSNC